MLLLNGTTRTVKNKKGNTVSYEYYDEKPYGNDFGSRRVQRTEKTPDGKVVKQTDKPNSGNSPRSYGGYGESAPKKQ